jgi:glutaredoxin
LKIIELTTPVCAYCKSQKVILEQVGKERGIEVQVLDITDSALGQRYAEQCRVTTVPYLVFTSDGGLVVYGSGGFQSREAVLRALDLARGLER